MTKLPIGWGEISVADLAAPEPRAITDGPFGSSLKRSHYAPSGARVIRLSNLGDGQFLNHDQAFITPEHFAALKRHEATPGDILVAALGDPLGRACVLPEGIGPAIVKADCFRIRPSNIIDRNLFVHWLNSPQTRNAIAHSSHGLGRTRINLADLKSLRLPIPAHSEQRRIIAKLDSLFLRSSHARDELDRIPNLVDQYKQAVLAAAFTGKLTKDWRSKDLSLDGNALKQLVLDDRQTHRNAQGIRAKGANRSIPAKTQDLPQLPKNWIWLTFDECCWDLTVGHVGPMKTRYVASGTPFLRSFNVKPNRIDMSDVAFIDQHFDSELRKSRLRHGTIVVVRTGAPGTAAVIPKELDGANCSDLVICRPIDSLLPEYASHYINSAFAQKLVSGFQVGVAQQHFNVGAMSRLALPFTRLEEQREIVKRIEAAFAWLDKLAVEQTRASFLLSTLDQAILAKAFRGELVPRYSNDESAERPLRKIAKQREPVNRRRNGRARA